MPKKYLPFILLIVAALLFFWVKKNQRGKNVHIPITTMEPATGHEPFVRDSNHIVYSNHARCRMHCRHIDESEVKEILMEGRINYNRIESGPKGTSFPIEGITHDNQEVRIVFAPHDNELVVVTVIDLGTEWPCNCN